MQLPDLLRDGAVGVLAVFAGLSVRSAMRLMTYGQRATKAAIVGPVSAASRQTCRHLGMAGTGT